MRLKISETQKLSVVAFLTLISVNFWSFQGISEKQYDVLEMAASCLILLIAVVYSGTILRRGLRFRSNVLLFLLLPLLSVLGAYLYHGQPPQLTLLLLRLTPFWLFYFVLLAFDISAEKIIKMMVVIGCVWAFLTVVQQFSYPRVYFYTRGEGNPSLMRASSYRFGVAGVQFGTFVLLYFFYKYIHTKNTNLLYVIGLILIAIYYYGTRQVAAASVGCMLVAVLMLKGLSKWNYLFLFGAMGVLVVVVWQPNMIRGWLALTTQQMDNTDYVRIRSAEFYLNDYWPTWQTKLLGNGKPHEDCGYGVEMSYINKTLGFWRSDVGIIGVYNTFGIFYILNIVWFTLKGIFLKIGVEKDRYLRLPFLYSGVLLPLNVGHAGSTGAIFYGLLCYLVEKSLQEKQQAKEVSGEPTFRPKTVRARLQPGLPQA